MENKSLRLLVREDSYAYIAENYNSLKELVQAPINELEQIPGLGKVRSRQLQAILQLSKELLLPDENEYYIKQSSDAFAYLKFMSLYPEENLMVLCLNTKNRIIESKIVSVGSLNSSIVHPREVFKQAIRVHAASIIIAHNHPSGDPTPSVEDTTITTRLKECGKIVGIELLDHIIVGDGIFISLKEKGGL
jgi:DNA repair protein RadC